MRPRGEVRLALSMAAAQVGEGGATWRTLAHHACVGLEVARHTVNHMARSGELVVVGQKPEPGVCRPMTLFAPAAQQAAGGADLEDAVRSWAEFK